MAINRYNTPAEQNLMQTYVPLPFQEMAAAAQMVQQRHDTAETLADSLDDNILNISTARPLDKKIVDDYLGNLDTELSGLIKKHNGRYADMVPDLKLLQKRIAQDMRTGQLGSIVASGPEVGKYTEARVETKEEGLYNPLLDQHLGAGKEYLDWYNEGMKNIGTETNPNWVIDQNYYQNNVVGLPVSSYKYTGIHKAANMLEELDNIFGKVKPNKKEIVREVPNPENPDEMITVTEKVKNITPARIAEASIQNISSLSPNAQMELQYWADNLSDDAVLNYADNFIKTLLSDQMLAAEQVGGTQEDINNAITAVNEQYSDYWDNFIDSEGNITEEAKLYAQAYNISNEGSKYIHGDITYKNLKTAESKYKNNGINQTHKYQIVDVGLGAEIQITPMISSDGEDINDVSPDKVYNTFRGAMVENFSQYEAAVNEYLEFKANNPGDTGHLQDLLNIVDSKRYIYESNAFTQQLLTQQAAINANYKHAGYQATHPIHGRSGVGETGPLDDSGTPIGYGPSDITYGNNNTLLEDTYAGYNKRARMNIDVIFDPSTGLPVDPSDVQTIFKHIRNRTRYDEEGNILGFAPTGLGHDDHLYPHPNPEELYEYNLEHGYYPPDLDPQWLDYSGNHFIVWDSNYAGTPLDDAKVNLYGLYQNKLFGGRTRQINELSGTGNAKLDSEIAQSISINWMNKDFVFDTAMDSDGVSMVEKPGGDVEPLKNIIGDINGDGEAGTQEDVTYFLKQVKDGNQKILWESIPNSRSHGGAGGYRGVIKVPLNTWSKDWGKGGNLALYFDAPQAYMNEIMNYGWSEDGQYREYTPNEKVIVNTNYLAQMDLDRAIRQPGNIVPSATVTSTGQPVGYYYFNVNPFNGDALSESEYLFVPSRNAIIKQEVVDGELVTVHATGKESIDVDDNTRDLARILMLNDPDQQYNRDILYGQLDYTPTDDVEAVDQFPEQNPRIIQDIEDPNSNILVEEGVNINEEEVEEIDVTEILDRAEIEYPPESQEAGPGVDDPGFDPNAFPPEEGTDMPDDYNDQKIISLKTIPIDKEAFNQKIDYATELLDNMTTQPIDYTKIDPEYATQREDDASYGMNWLDRSPEAFPGVYTEDYVPSPQAANQLGALKITDIGDEVFPAGAIMSSDYRIWNLATGQQLDRDGNIIGPREFDRFYYQDGNKTKMVDFTWQDNLTTEGYYDPNEPGSANVINADPLNMYPDTDSGVYTYEPDGKPIRQGPEYPPQYPTEEPKEEVNPDANQEIIEIPQTGAPNMIAPGPQTYNFTFKMDNNTEVSGTFKVKKGQVWFDDSFNTYHTWHVARPNSDGSETLRPQRMQVKQQLLDQLLIGEEKINQDYYNVFAGLYGDLGGGAFEALSAEHQPATINGWIDDDGTLYDYKGIADGDLDDDTFYGELPEGMSLNDITLEYSDNYDPKYHNRDGSVKEEYINANKQILQGNFPNLEILRDVPLTLSDGTQGSLEELMALGKIALTTKSGDVDPFDSAHNIGTGLKTFNIPYSDVWRSPTAQGHAHEEHQEEGGAPVAAADKSFHVVGQAVDLAQKADYYGIYLIDLTKGGSQSLLGNQAFSAQNLSASKVDMNMIALEDIVYNGMRPWSGLNNELRNIVVQRLINLNKRDGYSLAQLSASHPDNNEWWHFSIGEMTTYRDPLLPDPSGDKGGGIYATYEFLK